MTLDELLLIYRVQFPVMQGYERDTWYDINGRIVFTNSKGLVGVGLPRKGEGQRGGRQCQRAGGCDMLEFHGSLPAKSGLPRDVIPPRC